MQYVDLFARQRMPAKNCPWWQSKYSCIIVCRLQTLIMNLTSSVNYDTYDHEAPKSGCSTQISGR